MDSDDPADAAARLEVALERIAVLAQRPAAPPAAGSSADVREIAQRLDVLIAKLRAALDRSPV
ncbi:conserved protein of unknown function [Rhodovastum atsumiense]|uniref:Uncharacterized protein n=1 Tax=Rhodovastum atsumiense TaxID=504468 RepID=A0A5M6IL91_9PROT|nr:hypothetical protein [Rhodovastum atsumiense]KAA5609031.1 hypothetical protein F1189_26125 [Rhodovastum atsumiense]CAH2604669.1 conserved protein of unknown function [Rhodovastum atsumiense]